MSHTYYNRQWYEAQSDLKDLLHLEMPEEVPQPEKERETVFQTLATRYIKYIQIFRTLESCYDQIVQPQKRRVLRQVLDGVMGRVLELKDEMVNLEVSEFHYFDDILSDLKLTPNDVEMPIPKYFTMERMKSLKDRQKVLEDILTKLGGGVRNNVKDEEKISIEDAVQMIQSHERAKQGRLRAKFMREIRLQEKRERNEANRGGPTLDPELAAIKIQKVWKGFSQRLISKLEREKEMVFIGMEPVPAPKFGHQGEGAVEQAARTERYRRLTQQQYEQDYQQALITIKEKVQDNEGPDIKDAMMQQIRQWIIECRDMTGRFPDYPDDDEGGSAAIFKEMAIEDVETDVKKEKKDKKSANNKKGKEKKKDKTKGKADENEEEEEGWTMAPSRFLEPIKEASEEYANMWKPRDTSNSNPEQKYEAEIIREQMRQEVDISIREQVDELMRQELLNLKMAVDGIKEKKGKKGKSGKKKKKSKSGKKGKKGKKEKDLTPDRTIDSLYEELVSEGIIVKYKDTPLSSYEGEFCYLGTTLRTMDHEPMPSTSDVRRLLTEYAILPLGSPDVHEKAPLTRSMMLAGPAGTGKKMLVNAICTETGANLFDLSPANIAGKYPGRDGLKLMLHMIYKVGRALQPSVFYIGDCDLMFRKKIPKTDETDPKRLKKELPKSLKTIKPEDRILLVGVTRTPFEAEMKLLAACYQKIMLIPRPDYASRHVLWRKLISKNMGYITHELDVSSLAKVSDGYTQGHIMEACRQVLTDHRIRDLPSKPLQAVEFILPLSRMDPIFKEEEEEYKNWYAKTPLGRKKTKLAQERRGDDNNKSKGEKTAKKGKKGKKKK